MQFVYNDGGRAASGYKGNKTGDCVTRAIAIATGLPYGLVYNDLNAMGQTERKGKRKRGKEGHPHAIDQDERDVAPRHGECAMREIDKIHEAEGDGQSACQHEQQHAVRNAVEENRQHRRW